MFISFEGGEGTGKTTLANALFKKMIQKHTVIFSKEPGGCETNLPIRNLLFSSDNKIDVRTEALLYAADRAEHLDKVILPALKKGQIVICDRYIDSSLAYQGYARELGEEFVKKINVIAMKTMPDITFYLDLDPQIGLQRIKDKREDKREYFDLQTLSFHQKVRRGFLNLHKQFPQRIFKIDANQPLEEIQSIIETEIQRLFKIKL
ncbi:MAG: Thymidylate kinase [Candidatus Phytoplasma pruni]